MARATGLRAGIISIHSLRVEGDVRSHVAKLKTTKISIHSLRVEGDADNTIWSVNGAISIHSLRVEGDCSAPESVRCEPHFNPLPPCGGRRCLCASLVFAF